MSDSITGKKLPPMYALKGFTKEESIAFHLQRLRVAEDRTFYRIMDEILDPGYSRICEPKRRN